MLTLCYYLKMLESAYKAMGIAMEDMVAANLAYDRANQEGVGTYIVL